MKSYANRKKGRDSSGNAYSYCRGFRVCGVDRTDDAYEQRRRNQFIRERNQLTKVDGNHANCQQYGNTRRLILSWSFWFWHLLRERPSWGIQDVAS